jgi:hypothetical protein
MPDMHVPGGHSCSPPSPHAATGPAGKSRPIVISPTRTTSNPPFIKSEATLTFAMARDTARSQLLALDLNKLCPLDTQMQSFCRPAIRAQLALDQKNPTPALSARQAASPIETDNETSP